MSTEIALREDEVQPSIGDLHSRSLDDLADVIRGEHQAVTASLVRAVQHALSAGEALLVAKDRVGPDPGWGKWKRFLRDVGMSTTAASVYMRIATYRDHIPASEMETIRDAAAWVRGLPAVSGGKSTRYPEATQREALRLRAEGFKLQDVSELLGISVTAINDWENPGRVETRRRANAKAAAQRKRAAHALERQQQAAEIKRIGGAPADAYSHLRKCMASLQRAIDGSEDPRIKRQLREAYNAMLTAEDQIVRTLRTVN